jgi:integrase
MALSEVAVKNSKHSGKPAGDKLADGGGMYLLVKASGKYWRMDYRFAGKRKTLALGTYPPVLPAQARRAREEARQLLAQGIDPGLHRKAQKLQRHATHENTFQAVAGQWLEQWRVGKADSTAKVKWHRLANDVFPAIGPLPINDVTPAMLVAITKTVNARGARDVAERVLNACSQVFRYAIAHGIASRNPAIEIRPSDILPDRAVKNHARVSEAQLPDLLRAIYDYKGRGDWMTSYSLQLLALTFVRTSELVETPWGEIDFERARWVIPAERMKMPTPHIIPLSRQALAIFQKLREMNGHRKYVFYSTRSESRHMSKGTMLQALYRMGYRGEMTGHGFRGLASTLLHENGFDHEHIELQLAHMERNKVSASYKHAKYLEPRASIMQWWGDYVENCTADNILSLPRRSA